MEWIIEDYNIILRAMASAIIMIFAMLIIVRINGLRSFAKITPIDFAVTITIGSVINSTIISDSNSIVKGTLIIGLLLLIQSIMSKLKEKYSWFGKKAYNEPIFLMKDGKFLYNNLNKSNISKNNILAKLRENNINQLKDVKVVVLETTGDISVISGDSIDYEIIEDVKDLE